MTDPAAPASAGLDPAAVAAFLAAVPQVGAKPPLTAELIAGGLSNLTYELRDAGGQAWVLRRPPLGHVLPTAHDMRREYRVISALAGTVPVARAYVLCEDPDVIGAPFYLMEKVEGVVLRTRAQCAALSVAQRRSVGESLVDVLAALHRVDPGQVGLADFGRPEGYLHRQLDRWDRQYAASQSREIRGLFELGDGLRAAVPVTQRSTILHGDYRLDNVMMRLPEGGQTAVAAVFDWEMSTLGDPLADLGLLLTYWEDPGHPSKDILAAAGGGLTNHEGFPGSREIVERYQNATGLIVDDLDWYIAFSHYKLAVILEGIHYRHERGLTLGEGFERAGTAVPALVEAGRRYLDRTR
ncbi:aminoglycoside phosphotransferase [Catenulispora acidiphila DSM 44928]|uniref:Aminoglycoside phosphotransferase n=1 Tax=Catenulispora acidiphila (strain DSM 44928 / JCM 14897 / NBRC 102108 / NRRL B-24433 / ID139908) TaxID=479433 RepID=C7QF80_CATAD|nr:phosphotransferase family protein [Catenulispora acidiphila]ACU74838.1 aminoglycoside phosphotransferase [Catenulispora acidiphila DSM 44928]